uniref:Monocyte to macrophage differentiation protein n=1 Tax=Strigamia maritima TaxID=126957 RepID=T1J1H7_STRMM
MLATLGTVGLFSGAAVVSLRLFNRNSRHHKSNDVPTAVKMHENRSESESESEPRRGDLDLYGLSGLYGLYGLFMNDPPANNRAYVPTDIEHIANVITHGLCVVPSVLGVTFLSQLASTRNQYVNGMIFGFALVALFSVSTSFHSVFYLGRFRFLKEVLHRCDRATIYIFIAASYTPWLNIRELRECSWTSNFGWLVWLMAFFGILYQQIYHERYKWIEITLYLIIGLFPAVALSKIQELFFTKELMLGGVSYMVGVVFFKSDGRIPCAHAIWHLFVGLGAFYHYLAVVKYLMGAKNERRYQVV